MLEDGAVGYWGSEGACGRIADSMYDFFEIVIRCPYWQDYLCEEVYQDREKLGKFAKENFERLKESFKADGFDLSEEQQKLADFLGLEKKVDVVDVQVRCLIVECLLIF